MIDVRELRIGNIFKTSDCDYFRVGEVYKKEDGLYCVENGIDFNGSSYMGLLRIYSQSLLRKNCW